jgi:hypothetical protein
MPIDIRSCLTVFTACVSITREQLLADIPAIIDLAVRKSMHIRLQQVCDLDSVERRALTKLVSAYE